MSPEQYLFAFMGAVGLFILNGIRTDQKELWQVIGDHLRDRKLHTHCGKEHEE
jgi:hypothetical protein